jgi:hypothetical protein
LVKLTDSCPVQVVPEVLLVKLTVYDGDAGVRVGSPAGVTAAVACSVPAAWAVVSGAIAAMAAATIAIFILIMNSRASEGTGGTRARGPAGSRSGRVDRHVVMTKLIRADESSVPLNDSVTVCPEKEDTSNVLDQWC